MAVVLAIFEFLLWLQPAATPSASGGGAASGGGSSSMSCGVNAAMMLGILAITYFFLLRPDAKRRQESEDMLKSRSNLPQIARALSLAGAFAAYLDPHAMVDLANKVWSCF